MYVGDFNGVLNDLKQRVNLATPRNADVWTVFQDCQGSYRDLIYTAKQLGICPPTYVVQHGRNASYDYGPPNSFQFNADKFLCWGKKDYEHMASLGFASRTHIVGCPLNVLIKPRTGHKEKVVLFVPVNTGKEEPENIAVYYELLKLKYHKASVKVLSAKEMLKNKWGINNKLNVPFNALAEDMDVVAKLLPWHDKALYHGSTILGYQDMPDNNKKVFSLLQNVDLVVGLDEGCTEIYAYGHDVPVVIVKGFKYRQHRDDGKQVKYVECDPYKTGAAPHVDIEDLADMVEYCLENPDYYRVERARVAEEELGLSYGNATDNILKVIKNDFKA
jgi:hypothetical protein